MVTASRHEITNEQRAERDRATYIRQALAAGEDDAAEWLRTAALDPDETTPEEDAEDARIAAERLAKGDFAPAEVVERQLKELHPEDDEFLDELEAKFPHGCDFVFALDPECAAGRVFFDRLREEWPAAAAFFLVDD